MHFKEWFEKEGFTKTELARKLGHSRVDAVCLWLDKGTVPQKRYREKIKEISGGQVTHFV
jgi:hypothetical protein